MTKWDTPCNLYMFVNCNKVCIIYNLSINNTFYKT